MNATNTLFIPLDANSIASMNVCYVSIQWSSAIMIVSRPCSRKMCALEEGEISLQCKLNCFV